MKPTSIPLVPLAPLALLIAATATGETAAFQNGVDGYDGTVDTYISGRSGEERYTFGDNAKLILAADTDPSPDRVTRQVLLRFDGLFGNKPRQVPPDATIDAATLILHREAGENGGFSNRNTLAEMRSAFDGDSTWDSFGGDGIQLDGPEAAAEPIATDTVFKKEQPRVEFDVTASVRRWASGRADNDGWVLTHREGQDTPLGYLSLEAGESDLADQRPRLEIRYTPANAADPAEPQ